MKREVEGEELVSALPASGRGAQVGKVLGHVTALRDPHQATEAGKGLCILLFYQVILFHEPGAFCISG